MTKKAELIFPISEMAENHKGNFPIFDPSDFTILKPSPDVSISGYLIGRFDDFKKYYEIDVKMKGNGYMVAGLDGVLYLVPDWKNLETKMKAIQLGEPCRIVVVDIVQKGEANEGETFIKCAVWRGL